MEIDLSVVPARLGIWFFSLVLSDNRNTRSTCPTSVFTGIGQTLMSMPDIVQSTHLSFQAPHIMEALKFFHVWKFTFSSSWPGEIIVKCYIKEKKDKNHTGWFRLYSHLLRVDFVFLWCQKWCASPPSLFFGPCIINGEKNSTLTV